MINYWYVSRDNEIFIDTDNFRRSEMHTSARIRGAIIHQKLNIKSIEFHTSNSENHLHTLITLWNDMSALERYTWAIIFHSDIYRGCCNIMRHLNSIPAPDVLITPMTFRREPDLICTCETKHNAETMDRCNAAKVLRGKYRVNSFFGNYYKGESIFKFGKDGKSGFKEIL